MEKQFDVFGIGNAIMDLQLRVDEEAIATLNLRKGTMRLLELTDQRELLDYAQAKVVYHSSGGSAANSIITVAQLTGRAAFGCLLGDDEFGRCYASEMENLNIRLFNTLQRGCATGTSVIFITPDSERTMNTHLGVNTLFSAEHIDEEALAASTWLYIEGYLFHSPKGRLAINRALEISRRSSVKVALSFSDLSVVEPCADALRNALTQCDLLFCNYEEARAFTGGETESDTFSRLTKLIPSAIITRGKEGAMVAYEGHTFTVPGFPVTPVDTTGAGDVFAGAFLYGITHNYTAESATKLACYLASRVVAQLGARLKSDIQKLIKESGAGPQTSA